MVLILAHSGRHVVGLALKIVFLFFFLFFFQVKKTLTLSLLSYYFFLQFEGACFQWCSRRPTRFSASVNLERKQERQRKRKKKKKKKKKKLCVLEVFFA
jgi:hypothetical protein